MSSSSIMAPAATTSAPKPGAWLAALQQHLIEGRNCDVVVRVSIEQPPAKRPCAYEGIAAGHGGNPLLPRQRQERIIEIPCYSPILTSRSSYFEAAVSGAYTENQQRRVEIVLEDEQAADDFKLLIKLSCGLSYIQDGEARLSKSMRLRLAFLGNTFEFVECVQECLQSLSEEELTLEDALILDEMPEELWEHEAAMSIRNQIIKVLTEEIAGLSAQLIGCQADPEATGAVAVLMSKVTKALVGIIDELGPREMYKLAEEKTRTLQLAGEALGKALELVDRMFEEGPTDHELPSRSGSDFYRLLPLRADVKALSAEAMKVLLGSEALQLRSENDAYYLLCAWFSQSHMFAPPCSSASSSSSSSPSSKNELGTDEGEVEDERHDLFKQLLPLLRFHHMSHDFLCAVVSARPFANVSGTLPYIMACSHILRDAPRASAQKDGIDVGDKDRSTKVKRSFSSQLDLVDLLPLKKCPSEPSSIYRYLGLGWGFPIAVDLSHRAEGTAGAFLYVGIHHALLSLPSLSTLEPS